MSISSRVKRTAGDVSCFCAFDMGGAHYVIFTFLGIVGAFNTPAASTHCRMKQHIDLSELPNPSSLSIRKVRHYFSSYGDNPSDYDIGDLGSDKKTVSVDVNDDDARIRDCLKRELLLLASVTNRGECATSEEKNIVIELITQLEVRWYFVQMLITSKFFQLIFTHS